MYRLDTSSRDDPADARTSRREAAVRSRSTVLETAILGLLNESPLHGYELRKRLNLLLGSFRAFSYGTLYPALKSLVARGLIETAEPDAAATPSRGGARPVTGRPPSGAMPPLGGRRGRIVYQLTAEGKEHLQTVLSSAGPAAWEDENFDVRFALFAQTDAETRLRILEGRRTRLTERLEAVRESAARTRERLDEYTLELQRHGLEQVEREVRWLDGLITTERDRARGRDRDHTAGARDASAPRNKERG
jgi:DNA-binding PadR family transcriptional regulator